MVRKYTILLLIGFSFFSETIRAQPKPAAWFPLEATYWKGLQSQPDESNSLALPGEAVYRVPAGKGWYHTGFRLDYDGAINGLLWYGLQFELFLEKGEQVNVAVVLRIPPQQGREEYVPQTTATVAVQGEGWQKVTIPWSSFDAKAGQSAFLKFIQEISIQPTLSSGRKHLAIRALRLTKGAVLVVSTPIRSKPAKVNELARYPVTITNCTDAPQAVVLGFAQRGWEAMPTRINSTTLSLLAGESKEVMVEVQVPERVPPGGHEVQTLTATPNGGTPQQLELITLRDLPAPRLLFTSKEWDWVRNKVKTYDWAKRQQDQRVTFANNWQAPPLRHGMQRHGETNTVPLFPTHVAHQAREVAEAWQLTRDKKYAEKVADFLRRLSNPTDGYPTTLQACQQGSVHEGQFFTSVARAYDMILDANILSAQDISWVEATLRLQIELQSGILNDGGVSNWATAEMLGGAFPAMAMQDLASLNRFIYGPAGFVDQLTAGTMDDGWWYEASITYNMGVASDFTELALACMPFGYNLRDAWFPVAYSPVIGLRHFERSNYLGMSYEKWGGNTKNYMNVKRLYDAVLNYPDYRGVIFGTSDGHEIVMSGRAYNLAYYAFRDPQYARVINSTGEEPDLLWGVPDIPVSAPADTTPSYTVSAYADNMGVAMLRSQTYNRPQREKIQAVLKYGTHGMFHGHFDRASLLSLMRYGRSFFNPETSWFGYDSPMYRLWTQASLSHNMVIVDQKMQEPVESKRLLFHTGELFQATAVETNARWSNPPFGGGYDMAEQMKKGGSYFPMPANTPAYGDLGTYSEPVLQRRLMIMMDDYLVLADYLKGKQSHVYDNVFQLRGATLGQAAAKQFVARDPQLNNDPLGAGQFITGGNRYRVKAPFTFNSHHYFAERGKDGQNIPYKNWESGGQNHFYNEPGVLHIDVTTAWPPQAEAVLAYYAESLPVNKRLDYRVLGDGKELASGGFGTWILGAATLDIPIKGIRTLQLSTQCNRRNGIEKTIFWGNPVLVTASGKEIPLSQLPVQTTNVDPGQGVGKDYQGFPVQIVGVDYDQAVPGEPADPGQPGLITVNLTGLNVVRFKATVGGDWPVGDADQVRKVCDIRTSGKEARFLSVVEPYENKSLVKKVMALSANKLRVELMDGRVHQITIGGLAGDGKTPEVTVEEVQNGQVKRQEKTTR